MEKYQKLDRFPLGSIFARGFLRDQMLRGKDGMAGHLHELEPDMLTGPYQREYRVPNWDDMQNTSWGAEVAGNFWSGYIHNAFTLDDPEMIETATDWVEKVMANQREDGYIGTYNKPGDNIYEDFNGWGVTAGLRGLIAFYEATGREDVLNCAHRSILWFCKEWAGDKKTSYVGAYLVEPAMFLYRHTRDARLLEFSEDYLTFLLDHDIYETSYKSFGSDDYHYNMNHVVAIALNLRMPALVYTVTGKEEYLNAVIKRIRMIREKSVQLSGGVCSPSEYLGPVGATMETEYCNFTYYNITYSYMSFITGDPAYGDYMEESFYNGAQGARKKDERAIAYMSAPNQIYATQTSSTMSTFYDMQVYAPNYLVACCPTNSVALVPEFVRGLFLRDRQDNVYAVAYGPCELKYKDIHIVENTNYPFRNSVSFEVLCNKAFALNLKVPGWSEGYQVTVNGEAVEPAKNDLGYLVLDRQWQEGDAVEITFKASIKVIQVDDSDWSNKRPLAVKYGALLFSYHIPENWQPIAGRPNTPCPEGWSWYNVWPKFEEPDDPDFYHRMGLRRNCFSWNVALDENLKPEDFQIEECPMDGYVWSNPPIKLHTHCYKAPSMNSAYEEKTVETFGAYQEVTHKLPLTLEPYGCTNLRITYFPKAKLPK